MVERQCPVQASCGGCPYLDRDRQTELATKLGVVSAELTAVGVDIGVAFAPGASSSVEDRFEYRNRLRMKVVDGRAGFFNQAKRNGCPVVRPDLWAAVQTVCAVTSGRSELLAGVEHLEVRVGDDGSPGLMLPVSVELDELQAALGADWAIACPGVEPTPTLRYNVTDGVTVEVPVTSFVQVNSDVNRQLVGAVLAVADRIGAASFIDLFSGAGNFSIPLVAQGRSGVAVDNVGDAIAELGRSPAAVSGDLRCVHGDARHVLAQLETADLVIADPPRAGLGGNYHELTRLVGDTLVLIGCRTSSFVGDVAALVAQGLVLDSVTVFDMFPGTKHVETMAIFSR